MQENSLQAIAVRMAMVGKSYNEISEILDVFFFVGA
jgi:hypothetical protein